MKTMHEDFFKAEGYAIQGAVFEVYKTLGHGFLEPVYQESLELELRQRQIPFMAQAMLPVFYKGQKLRQSYRADLICYGQIILELKATPVLLPEFVSQLLNYLHATGLHLGYLINFGHEGQVEIKRLRV